MIIYVFKPSKCMKNNYQENRLEEVEQPSQFIQSLEEGAEEFKDFFEILTGEQQSILLVLLHNKKAMNPHKIRNQLIKDVYLTTWIECEDKKTVQKFLDMYVDQTGKKPQFPAYYRGDRDKPFSPKEFLEFSKEYSKLAPVLNLFTENGNTSKKIDEFQEKLSEKDKENQELRRMVEAMQDQINQLSQEMDKRLGES